MSDMMDKTRDWAVAVGCFAVGIATGAALVYLKRKPPTISATTSATKARTKIARFAKSSEHEAELLDEQLSRNRLFFGEENQKKVEDSFVVVVGLGGVGSHCAHMLARSGIKKIRLVDFDNVTLSSLNRHSVATRDDVGRPKVTVAAEHFKDFAPSCEVEAIAKMFNMDTVDEVLQGQPDYVVDCIDDVNTKADLLLACHHRKLKVISCMGSGAKADPTRVLIGDLTDPICDPLANKLHYTLRMKLLGHGKENYYDEPEYMNAVKNIRVIFSSELPRAQLAKLSDEQAENPEEFGAIQGFRLRVLPVLGTQPAIIGMGAASHVMCELAQKPINPRAVEGISLSYSHRLHQRLINREKKEFGTTGAENLADQMEVVHLVEAIFKRQSAYSGKKYSRDRQAVTRWDRSKPAMPYNLVLLTEKEATLHDKSTAKTGSLPEPLMNDDESWSFDEGEVTIDLPSKKRLGKIQQTLKELEEIWHNDNIM